MKRMRSNQSTIRARGQRLLPSTFIHKKSANDDPSSDRREKCENVTASKKRSKISLSDFLDRKLQKTSNPVTYVQGKERPFFSPVTSVGADKKTEKPELNGFVLEQFKHSKDNENNTCCNLVDEGQSSNLNHVTEESQNQDLSKKRSLFRGKGAAPKGLVILGGDPTPKETKYEKGFSRKEKGLPNYNHYAGGSGWWDSNMEGIDNAEVGFNENQVWEGVGSSTMGGLHWH